MDYLHRVASSHTREKPSALLWQHYLVFFSSNEISTARRIILTIQCFNLS